MKRHLPNLHSNINSVSDMLSKLTSERSSASGQVEPMQVDVSVKVAEENGNDIKLEPDFEVENPTLDLDHLVGQFEGHALLIRLMFIAEHSPSLKVEALVMAMDKVQKDTYNTQLYWAIQEALRRAVTRRDNCELLPNAWGGKVPPMDYEWEAQTRRSAAVEMNQLDTDLRSYKSSSIKNGIRQAYEDIGDHYIKCGDIHQALISYTRARDYCTSPSNLLQFYNYAIRANLYLKNWGRLLDFVKKVEEIPDSEVVKEQELTLKDHCLSAAGVALMCHGQYRKAAKYFLQCKMQYSCSDDAVPPMVVVLYGSLCALATYDRQEFETHVLHNPHFGLFLEQEHKLREMVQDFHQSRYASCLGFLVQARDSMLLDVYLHCHVDQLFTLIRNRGLCQYISPYLSMDMHKMAGAFNVTVKTLEEELMALILEGQINARIDSHNKILFAKEIDQRSITYEKALAVGKDYQRRTAALILKAAVFKSGIEVRGKYAQMPGTPPPV